MILQPHTNSARRAAFSNATCCVAISLCRRRSSRSPPKSCDRNTAHSAILPSRHTPDSSTLRSSGTRHVRTTRSGLRLGRRQNFLLSLAAKGGGVPAARCSRGDVAPKGDRPATHTNRHQRRRHKTATAQAARIRPTPQSKPPRKLPSVLLQAPRKSPLQQLDRPGPTVPQVVAHSQVVSLCQAFSWSAG